MKHAHLPRLFAMRTLVGFLGERAQYGWWPTAFYESSSRLFLEPVFAKTTHLSQYHGVVEAARRLHDEHLSAGSYHLFRLPEEVEQDLHWFAQDGEEGTLIEQVLKSQSAALEALSQLASKDRSSKLGPVLIGGIDDLKAPNTLQTIAAAYQEAFTENTKIYPYLAG